MNPSVTHPLLRDDHTSAWLGLEVVRADYGDVVVRAELREEMLNGHGIAHGGMLFAIADSAFALACNDPAGDGSTLTVASGADVNFLRPAHRGQVIEASARAVSVGRSGVYDVTVTAQGADDPEPVVVALFRGRSRTIPAKAPAAS